MRCIFLDSISRTCMVKQAYFWRMFERRNTHVCHQCDICPTTEAETGELCISWVARQRVIMPRSVPLAGSRLERDFASLGCQGRAGDERWWMDWYENDGKVKGGGRREGGGSE